MEPATAPTRPVPAAFLPTPTPTDLAHDVLRLAEASPADAAVRAADVTRIAVRAGDVVAHAVAERAWGLALRHAGDLDSAIAHLRRAVRLALAGGVREVAGEARITLAFALVERGRAQLALGQIERALRELSGTAHARALTQRGTILLEVGRHADAQRDYEAALPVLTGAGDLLWVYRVVWNRGLARAYRHEFAAAESDLRAAEQLAGQLSLPLSVGFAQANIAFVLGLRGDVPAALEYSARAEDRIRAERGQLGELLKDRSELLLSVRLVAEARDTAEQAIAEYQREQRSIKLPQVRLVLAQAALLEGDADSALRHGGEAVREFARQQRHEWAALARLTLLGAGRLTGRLPRTGIAAAEQAVRTLERAGWPTATLEARLLTAALLADGGRSAEARVHLRAAGAARRSGPAVLRARGWFAEAQLRCLEGRSRGASSAIRAGLRVLDEHRSVLGATDLRARAAGHRTELVELGLRIALDGGSARQVFEWAERGRATDLLMQRPVRPPEQPEAAQLLAELRAIVLRINEVGSASGGDGAGVAQLLQQQTVLERRVRDRARVLRGAGSGELPAPVSVAELAGRLDVAGLLELVVADGTLLAVTVVDGRTRMRRLGPAVDVDGLVDRIAYAQRRLLREDGDTAGRAAARQLLRHAAARLDACLLQPLPELADRPLVVVPTGSLQCLPWAVLPSCSGRAVTVAPSATTWHAARGRAVPAARGVLVAAGPTLPGAVSEVHAVADVHGVRPLLPPDAGVDQVLAGMEGAALVHLAAHGRLAAHNPLFSDVLLADGPMLAYDVERLQRAPHTVVLAACESARSVVCAGDELLGLGSVFLAAGTCQLIAPVLPVRDAETVAVMVAFHRLLAAGRSAADALATVQAKLADDAVAAAAVSFVSLGAGFDAPLPADRAVVPAPVTRTRAPARV